MQQPYCLVLDVWEGQLEIDEAELRRGGVEGLVIRLNDMNGGHHMDAGFVKQWAEAENFYRAPYFVYNPWVSGQANFDWLKANMPTTARAVMCDIEVRYSGITPAAYAAEVDKFMRLVAAQWKTAIYTGEWFLSNLAYWSKDYPYWWAQYPLAMYPAETTVWTWEKLRTEIDKLARPFNESKSPGPVRMWQMSGDRIILPGNSRPMDINVFYGGSEQLAQFFGYDNPLPPPPPPTPQLPILDITVEAAGYYPGKVTLNPL